MLGIVLGSLILVAASLALFMVARRFPLSRTQVLPGSKKSSLKMDKLHNFLASVTGQEKVGFIDYSQTSLYGKLGPGEN